MRPRYRIPLSLMLALLFALSCGGDDGESEGTCPNVAGAYEITSHSCNSGQVGSTVTIEQSECKILRIDPWPSWHGTVSGNGTMTWSGDAGGTTMTCVASLGGSTITASCDPSCDVVLTKN